MQQQKFVDAKDYLDPGPIDPPSASNYESTQCKVQSDQSRGNINTKHPVEQCEKLYFKDEQQKSGNEGKACYPIPKAQPDDRGNSPALLPLHQDHKTANDQIDQQVYEQHTFVNKVEASPPLLENQPKQLNVQSDEQINTTQIYIQDKIFANDQHEKQIDSEDEQQTSESEIEVIHPPDEEKITALDANDTNEQPKRRIMVAVDGSKYSDRAVEWVQANFESIIILTNCRSPLPISVYLSDTDLKKWDHEKEIESREILEKAGQVLQAFEVYQMRLKGKVRYEICKAIDIIQADMVVLGTRETGFLKKLVLGSVSKYLIAHAKRPVLIIKGR